MTAALHPGVALPPWPRWSPTKYLLLPATIFLLTVFLVPVWIFFSEAFHPFINGRSQPQWNLSTFVKFATDFFYFETLLNSAYLGVVTTVLSLLLAYPAALIMIRLRGTPMFYVLAFAVFSPVLVSVIVRAYGWQLLLSNNGVVNYLLSSLGLVDRPVRLMFNWTGVIISMVHIQLPFMLFPILTVLMQLPRGLIEAAQDLGATYWQVLWRVIIPLSLPGILAGSQIVFTTGISAFASPTILGGGRVRVMPVAIYQNIVGLNWPMGAVQSILLLLFSLVIVLIFSRVLRVRGAWSGEGQ